MGNINMLMAKHESSPRVCIYSPPDSKIPMGPPGE